MWVAPAGDLSCHLDSWISGYLDISSIFNLQSWIFNLQSSIFDLRSSIFNLQCSIFDLRPSIFNLQSQGQRLGRPPGDLSHCRSKFWCFLKFAPNVLIWVTLGQEQHCTSSYMLHFTSTHRICGVAWLAAIQSFSRDLIVTVAPCTHVALLRSHHCKST